MSEGVPKTAGGARERGDKRRGASKRAGRKKECSIEARKKKEYLQGFVSIRQVERYESGRFQIGIGRGSRLPPRVFAQHQTCNIQLLLLSERISEKLEEAGEEIARKKESLTLTSSTTLLRLFTPVSIRTSKSN